MAIIKCKMCGGDLEIDYAIDGNNALLGRSKLSMNVKKDHGSKLELQQ